ncbi:MAG TPA: hypothetical protein VKH37_05275 [Ferruginibacter sp.]|nr:hypothetical protein [Ferruginibacter sp.]
MRFLVILGLCFLFGKASAQELFVFTEPASNMATGTLGIRMNNSFMYGSSSFDASYQFAPELMLGVNKKLMLHVEGFFNNSNNNRFSYVGIAGYAKYRFYSVDDVHSHFRMAAFGRISSSNSPIMQEAIDLNGSNTGYEAGLVATKLLNKFAYSASASFLYAMDNRGGNKFVFGYSHRNAFAYSASIGKLLLPKVYTSYKQTNLNAMLEFLGQANSASGRGYLDIAPSFQLIINSVARIDVGQRIKIGGNLQRTAANTGFLRLEYNFFNLFNK